MNKNTAANKMNVQSLNIPDGNIHHGASPQGTQRTAKRKYTYSGRKKVVVPLSVTPRKKSPEPSPQIFIQSLSPTHNPNHKLRKTQSLKSGVTIDYSMKDIMRDRKIIEEIDRERKAQAQAKSPWAADKPIPIASDYQQAPKYYKKDIIPV